VIDGIMFDVALWHNLEEISGAKYAKEKVRIPSRDLNSRGELGLDRGMLTSSLTSE
jgi:hypothetical protein